MSSQKSGVTIAGRLDIKRYPYKYWLAISKAKKFVFLRNPKAASRALTLHLQKHVPDLIWKRNKVGEILRVKITPDYFIFGICRDPLDRFISACNFLNWHPERALHNLDNNLGRSFQRAHFAPQHTILVCGKMYRFENPGFLDQICERLKIPGDVPENNVSVKKYDPTKELSEEICKRFQKDYQTFDYPNPFPTS